jgi:hypothetical protein
VERVTVCPFAQKWIREKYCELLVCDVITPISRPLILDELHGFVGGRSKLTSLVEFSNFVLCEMKDGFQVDVDFTDFSKAFDRVNHVLLLATLTLTQKFRRPMIFWMGSYLTGVLVDSTMTFVDHIESIVLESSIMLRFIKRILREFNDPYTYKTLNAS